MLNIKNIVAFLDYIIQPTSTMQIWFTIPFAYVEFMISYFQNPNDMMIFSVTLFMIGCLHLPWSEERKIVL